MLGRTSDKIIYDGTKNVVSRGTFQDIQIMEVLGGFNKFFSSRSSRNENQAEKRPRAWQARGFRSRFRFFVIDQSRGC